jgi:hypothetical protein
MALLYEQTFKNLQKPYRNLQKLYRNFKNYIETFKNIRKYSTILDADFAARISHE